MENRSTKYVVEALLSDEHRALFRTKPLKKGELKGWNGEGSVYVYYNIKPMFAKLTLNINNAKFFDKFEDALSYAKQNSNWSINSHGTFNTRVIEVEQTIQPLRYVGDTIITKIPRIVFNGVKYKKY